MLSPLVSQTVFGLYMCQRVMIAYPDCQNGGVPMECSLLRYLWKYTILQPPGQTPENKPLHLASAETPTHSDEEKAIHGLHPR